jgi:putative transposase
MDYPQRKRMPHDIPSWVSDDAIFFITICCAQRGINQLCQEPMASLLFESIEFRQQKGVWYMHLCLLMPDHLHALISFPRDQTMKKAISYWKENTAKSAGVKWQRDYFDHRLRGGESFREKATYIRMNPVRKGLVQRPEDWSYVWDVNGRPSGPTLPTIG